MSSTKAGKMRLRNMAVFGFAAELNFSSPQSIERFRFNWFKKTGHESFLFLKQEKH